MTIKAKVVQALKECMDKCVKKCPTHRNLEQRIDISSTTIRGLIPFLEENGVDPDNSDLFYDSDLGYVYAYWYEPTPLTQEQKDQWVKGKFNRIAYQYTAKVYVTEEYTRKSVWSSKLPVACIYTLYNEGKHDEIMEYYAHYWEK